MTPRDIPYAELAAGAQLAAYSDSTQVSNWAKAQGLSNVEIYEKGGTFAFLAHNGELAVVAFRGTNSIRDWFRNADCRKLRVDRDVHFHKGFHDYMDTVGWQLHDDLDRLDEDAMAAGKPGIEVLLTGHSLGAAAAGLFAYQFGKSFHQVVIHLFGCPRFINAEGRNRLQFLFPNTWTWINNSDIVPRVPLPLPKWLQSVVKLWRWGESLQPGGLRRVGRVCLFDVCGKFVPDPSFGKLLKDFLAGILDHVGTRGLATVCDHSPEDYFRLVSA